VSAGEKDVSRVVTDDVGEARLRIFERVDRNFRRMRCGIMVGKDENILEAEDVTVRRGAKEAMMAIALSIL